MRRSKIGEAILTADGKSVAAFWAAEVSMPADHLHFMPSLQLPKVVRFYDMEPNPTAVAKYTIWHHASMPDGRNYWRISEGAPSDWWHDHELFSAAKAEPGPAPKGMVRAIDELLNKNSPDHNTRHWLSYIRGYWQHLADNAARQGGEQ